MIVEMVTSGQKFDLKRYVGVDVGTCTPNLTKEDAKKYLVSLISETSDRQSVRDELIVRGATPLKAASQKTDYSTKLSQILDAAKQEAAKVQSDENVEPNVGVLATLVIEKAQGGFAQEFKNRGLLYRLGEEWVVPFSAATPKAANVLASSVAAALRQHEVEVSVR